MHFSSIGHLFQYMMALHLPSTIDSSVKASQDTRSLRPAPGSRQIIINGVIRTEIDRVELSCHLLDHPAHQSGTALQLSRHGPDGLPTD